MTRLLSAVLLTAGTFATVTAADWPAWRGPTGQGHSTETNLPLKWGGKDNVNVKWKAPLNDPGYSTPIVWGDKVFLTQANKATVPKKDEKGKIDSKQTKDGTIRSLICLARADGKILWQQDVKYDAPERRWQDFPYCHASPVTDGERIVVSHGSAGVYCYDFEGKELWKRTDLGKWDHGFGNSASPVLYGDLVIQWCGVNENPKERNTLVAMDKKTGKTEWQTEESFGSWSTPVIAKVNGKEQLVLGQSRDVKGQPENKTGFLKGYDPKTGSELWKCQGLNSYQYTSPLVANGIAVGMSGYGGSALAVKLGGEGDITKDRLWLHPKPASQRVGSGVIVGDHIYMVDEAGVVHCYDPKTGNDLWKDEQKLNGPTWGSLVHADGRLYLLMRNGTTYVLAAKPKFELLATNTLPAGENTNSSVAISNGQIFVRTFKHLWCIEEKKK